MECGMDASYHQGDIDFKQVKKSGIDFVILREGYRMATDPKFFEYVKQCKENGLKILGIYHFAYGLNNFETKKEALHCIENLEKAGLDESIIIFYDFEYDTIKKASKVGVNLTKKECNSHTNTFCEVVEAKGYKSGIYLNLDFYKNWYEDETLKDRIIWLADYKDGPDFKCTIQQYTSKGKIPGIKGNVDLNYYYDEEFKMNDKKLYSRKEVVKLITSWIGKRESDGSHKEIIDIYNSLISLPRGLKMKYDWAWCACTWSALAIKLGYMEIMPIEISCGNLITKAKEMGIWKENDGYVPKPGDGILYDWDDSGVGDNVGWPDHIGTVTYVNEDSGYIEVVEGNYNDSVKKRTISINGKFIRGFITPKYDLDDAYSDNDGSDNILKSDDVIAHEVIAGKWGNGEERKQLILNAGYDYSSIQSIVTSILNPNSSIPKNQDQSQPVSKKIIATCSAKKKDPLLSGSYITRTDLYCRNDAGKNKKAICLIPKGTIVQNYGYYNESDGIKWLYIQFVLDRVQYTGFSSIKYLDKR